MANLEAIKDQIEGLSLKQLIELKGFIKDLIWDKELESDSDQLIAIAEAKNNS